MVTIVSKCKELVSVLFLTGTSVRVADLLVTDLGTESLFVGFVLDNLHTTVGEEDVVFTSSGFVLTGLLVAEFSTALLRLFVFYFVVVFVVCDFLYGLIEIIWD